jgi:hypothetical protein
MLETVKDDIITFGDDPPELDALPRILARHPFKVLDERRFTVRNHRVVLYVGISDVSSNSLSRLTPVEHEVVEGLYGCLVALQGTHEASRLVQKITPA